MRNTTRVLFNKYTAQIAKVNGVPSARDSFATTPTVSQKMEERIAENAEFLQSINVVPVDQQSGQVLGLGSSGTIAGRTDTTINDRTTSDPTDLNEQLYDCKQTNFYTHVTYAKLDMWAKFPDFQVKMRNQVLLQQARDRMMIGFNGTSHAVETNRGGNPLLQDVNIGWLEKLRVGAAARVLSGIKVGPDAGNDYKNFDAMVNDMIHELLDPWHRNDTGIIAIAGNSIVQDKYQGLIADNDAPTEKAALQTLMSNKALGGKKTEVVPFFPDDAIFLTSLDNLSIYVQDGTRRRKIDDNAKRDRVEDYNSVNEAYVIEDLGRACLVEGILQWNGAAWA